MKNLKLYLKNILIMSAIFIISTLFMTTLSYFNIINDKLVSIFQILIMIITLFIGGFLTGNKATSKGYKEGFIIGLIFTAILLLINIIFIHNFELKNIIYFIILLICSSIGGMIGILKK